MNCIIMAEIETDAPIEAFERLGAITIEVNVGGMIWKPYIKKINLFSAKESEDESKSSAIKRPRKALSKMYPNNMGMHMGMSMVGEGD